jgi:hypothetical protein
LFEIVELHSITDLFEIDYFNNFIVDQFKDENYDVEKAIDDPNQLLFVFDGQLAQGLLD